MSYAIANSSGESSGGGTTQDQLDALEKELRDAIALHLPLTGGTLTGDLVLADGGKAISDIAVDAKIAAAGHLKREIVDVLPDIANADPNTIYMVGNADGTNYTEYMPINGTFEPIGDTTADLTNYLTKITGAIAGNVAILNADGTLADGLVAATDIANHLDNDLIHITTEERTLWNSLVAQVGTVPVATQISNAVKHYELLDYEIAYKPTNTKVKYSDHEIRIMCPADTKWQLQTSGANADTNIYYIGFKAYAPADAVAFKEDLAQIISDQTLYSFENNEFAGIDEYGRKYSIVWLAAAKYDTTTSTWTYYGAKSTTNHYVGWDYTVEWYGVDGGLINGDTIRINLSNEDCHNNPEPYYMGKAIKEVKLNGTVLDVVNNSVDIATANVINESEEIGIDENNGLYIKKISADKLSTDGAELVLNGGSAT